MPNGSAQHRDDASKLKVCICLATCRRPSHLEKTLESIAAQRFEKSPPSDLRVIVVENDLEQLGLPIVEGMRVQMPWPIEYEVEKCRGISFVRNRLVQLTEGADLIAFIDDDEIAEPQWLDELLSTRVEMRADVVLGPVLPRFESNPPPWLAPFFDRQRHPSGRSVDATDFRTGNVLLETSALHTIDGPFDPAFTLTGGSDGYLGRVLEARGVRFFWADEAIVHESVPAARARVSWLLRRRFRTGMALAMIRLRRHGRLRGTALILYKGTGALLYGLITMLSGIRSGRRGLLAGLGILVFGAGSLFGLVGVRYHEYTKIHGDAADQTNKSHAARP